jgi:hypothetical protein
VRHRTDAAGHRAYLQVKGKRILCAEGLTIRIVDPVSPSSRESSGPGVSALNRASDTVVEPKGNDVSKLMIALFVAAGLCVAGSASAQMNPAKSTSTPITKDGYELAKKNADAQYKVDKDACSSLSGNTKDICTAEAKGKDEVAKAEAAAAYENTPKAREAARIAHAQATYGVAIEKCDDLAGNRKDVCVKEAKAALVKGQADAKVDRVAADTRQDAATKQNEASKEANADKRDAEFKVAIEKCEALAGPSKDACVGNAKVQYRKS